MEAFRSQWTNYLKTQVKVLWQERRIARIGTEEFPVPGDDWKDYLGPSYREEVMPQTLTDKDVKANAFESMKHIYYLEDGRILESYIQKSAIVGTEKVDYLGVRDRETKEPIPEYCWPD
jgi:hypothetical protein